MSARIAVAASLLAALFAGAAADPAMGHSGLLSSDPLPNSTLGASPGSVRLTFSEQPEASLSEIRVLDENDAEVQSGAPESLPGDPLTLAVGLPQLPRGSYTVAFRAISAVDGHATAGVYAFGVGVAPGAVTTAAPGGDDGTSGLELVARWALLAGLAVMLGAAVAALAGFGGSTGTDVLLAGAAWLLSVVGLVLLAVVQSDAAGSSFGELADTPVGDALIARAVAISVAGAGVIAALLAGGASPLRRIGLVAAAIGAVAAIAIHVDAGHAAATAWSSTVTVSAQVAHFAAAGVWVGGLAALLLGIRGAPSAAKADAVRRFAIVAAVALLVVVVTGTIRAVDELNSLGELFSTGYGRAVLAKIVLIAAIVAFAFANRRRSVPGARRDLAPLRRISRVELGLAAAAVAVAALLGSLAPAVEQPEAATASLSASGSDAAGTVEAELEAASDQPGPNAFTLEVDYESGDPIDADPVILRFDPLDDPGVGETELTLEPTGDGGYAGSGDNLAFDGRWGVTVVIGRGADAVEIPLELDLPIAPPIEGSLSVLRLPDQPVEYTLQVGDDGYIRVTVDPEQPGPNELVVTLYSVFQNLAPTEQLVVTTQAGDGPVAQQPVERLAPARFAAEAELEDGENTIVVVAQTRASGRLRGVFELDVGGD